MTNSSNDSAKTQSIAQMYRLVMAEFTATTLLVWCGCGSAVASQAMQTLDATSTLDNSFLITVSLAFGLAVAVLVYTIAPISGGHMNPAVTFAFAVSGKMSVLCGVRYVIAQCLGALLGASLVWGSAASNALTNDGEHPPFNVGMNSVHPLVSTGSAFIGEFMGTFLLVWTVIMTAVSTKSMAGNIAPIAIGLSVSLANFMLIPFTGCGINPARVLGPMLVVILTGGKAGMDGWWVYYTAPFVGSGAAVLVCNYIFDAFDNNEKTNTEKESTEAPPESAPHEWDGHA